MPSRAWDWAVMQEHPYLVQGVVRATGPTRLGRVHGQLSGEDGAGGGHREVSTSPCPCLWPGSEAKGAALGWIGGHGSPELGLTFPALGKCI